MNIRYFIAVLCALPVLVLAQGIPSSATFGRHSNCSTGRGACSMTLSKSETGIFVRKSAENTITLELQNASVKEADQIKIAGKRFSEIKSGEVLQFQQDEGIAIDSTTIENLNLNRNYYRIAPGNYALKITKDKTEIVFLLKSTD